MWVPCYSQNCSLTFSIPLHITFITTRDSYQSEVKVMHSVFHVTAWCFKWKGVMLRSCCDITCKSIPGSPLFLTIFMKCTSWSVITKLKAVKLSTVCVRMLISTTSKFMGGNKRSDINCTDYQYTYLFLNINISLCMIHQFPDNLSVALLDSKD